VGADSNVPSNDTSGLPSARKLAFIGPVSPFRGGIAQYATALHRALSRRCELQTVSFRRLYPAWLYPGKSDREPGMEGHTEPGVTYLLDALNPLTWTAAARAVAARKCDLAIINWWTIFWAPGLALIARMLRKRDMPVVFLVHNLSDHDAGAFKRAVSKYLLSQAAGYLVHSNEQAVRLRQWFPEKPVLLQPVPAWDRFPPALNPRPQRGRLELLFFGFIRPYKGLDTLVDAVARLADQDVHLTVVGEPWCPPQELRARIQASGAPNIELHLEYVDDNAVADFFARADLVVLPYRAATPSAVAAVAYHYDRPVLASRVPGLREVVEEGRTGFLVDPDSPDQLADQLRSITRVQLQQMRPNVQAYKSRFTWDSLAAAAIDFASAFALDERQRKFRSQAL
jgi:glycosyltransferase involved in cell wall biosynthesis